MRVVSAFLLRENQSKRVLIEHPLHFGELFSASVTIGEAVFSKCRVFDGVTMSAGGGIHLVTTGWTEANRGIRTTMVEIRTSWFSVTH